MAKTVAMIITNDNILVRDNESDEFKTFTMPSLNPSPNIPFYHEFAEKIAECQYYFKEFMKGIYGKKLNKYILAIIVPDDTSKLESIFIILNRIMRLLSESFMIFTPAIRSRLCRMLRRFILMWNIMTFRFLLIILI